MSKEEELLDSKRQRKVREFKSSEIYQEVLEIIHERLRKNRAITMESFDVEKIFRAQGAIQMAFSIFRALEALENKK